MRCYHCLNTCVRRDEPADLRFAVSLLCISQILADLPQVHSGMHNPTRVPVPVPVPAN